MGRGERHKMSINTARLEHTDTYSVSFVVGTHNGDRILRPYTGYGHILLINVRDLKMDNYMSKFKFHYDS